MVKRPKFGIKDMAALLNARKNDGHSTVLLLGSRAGAFFRSEQFYETLQQWGARNFTYLTSLKRFQECYTVLTANRYSETDIYHLLRASINDSVVASPDIYLALLIKQGYFKEIITTNVDDSLEQAFVKAQMREGYDFEICYPDQWEPNDERHAECRMIKVFGDMKRGKFAIRDRLSYLESNQEFKRFLERLLKRDVLMVGFDTVWDQDILRAISAKGQSLWFVNEENLSKEPLLSNLLHARQAQCIMASSGSYDLFMNTLYAYCLEKKQVPMTAQAFTHGYALLIGVGADLSVTVDDATAMRDLLVDPSHAGYLSTQVTLLTEARANRDGILAAFEQLIQQVKSDPEATVIVYFSGHGGKFRFPGQEPEYFLVPYGYDPSCAQETALSDQEFTEKIEAIQARKLIVLLDCCHAGGVPLLKNATTTFEKSPVPPGLLDALQTGSGRVVITSSRENENSYTGTPYSVFTACLLEAFSGKASASKDGFARILDVVSYLFEQVPQRTSDKQHTFVKKMLDLDDNFPLCYYAGGNKTLPSTTRPQPRQMPRSAILTAGQRQRLETKRQQLQTSWESRHQKIEVISRAEALEYNPAIKFQYQQQIMQEKAELKRIEDELDEIEQKLSQQ